MLSRVGTGVAGGSIFGGTVGALAPKGEDETRGQKIRKSIARGAAMGAGGSVASMPFKGNKSRLITQGIGGGAASAGLAYPSFKTQKEKEKQQERKIRRLERRVQRMRK